MINHMLKLFKCEILKSRNMIYKFKITKIWSVNVSEVIIKYGILLIAFPKMLWSYDIIFKCCCF